MDNLEQQKQDLLKEVDLRIKHFFGQKVIGDNPTDALQLVNKRYFITGGPGSVIGANSVITIDPNKGRLFKLTTNSSITTGTVNASVAGKFGQQLQIILSNDSTAARTLVFASLFGASSLVGIRSSVATISFVSDSTKFWETARTQGL